MFLQLLYARVWCGTCLHVAAVVIVVVSGRGWSDTGDDNVLLCGAGARFQYTQVEVLGRREQTKKKKCKMREGQRRGEERREQRRKDEEKNREGERRKRARRREEGGRVEERRKIQTI